MLAQGFLDVFFGAAPHLEYFSNFLSSALKPQLLKRHLTLSEENLLSKHIWARFPLPMNANRHIFDLTIACENRIE